MADESQRYKLTFKTVEGLAGQVNQASYDGRVWSYDRTLKTWKLIDTSVLEFTGGDAITVDTTRENAIGTSFDMEKVPLAQENTSSES